MSLIRKNDPKNLGKDGDMIIIIRFVSSHLLKVINLFIIRK